jgi:Helix-turn-helix domain
MTASSTAGPRPLRFTIEDFIFDGKAATTFDAETKLIICYILHSLNGKTNVAFPSYDTIAAKTKLSYSTVKRRIKIIKRAGLFDVKRHKFGAYCGRRVTTQYRPLNNLDMAYGVAAQKLKVAAATPKRKRVPKKAPVKAPAVVAPMSLPSPARPVPQPDGWRDRGQWYANAREAMQLDL